jgi:hypothetical protein
LLNPLLSPYQTKAQSLGLNWKEKLTGFYKLILRIERKAIIFVA